MLRVLHVVSYYPPDRIGGVGEVVAHLHRSLQDAGHHSTVLTTGKSNGDPSVIRIAPSPGLFSIASILHSRLAQHADIVHIHHGEGIGLLAAMRARRVRTPVLLTLHVGVAAMRRSLGPYRVAGMTLCRDSLRRFLYRHGTMRARAIMDRLAISLADGMTFISRSAAQDVLGPERGIRAAVIYNSVPPAPPGLESSLARVDVLFVGTNTERKRVEMLPLILFEMRKRLRHARLRIAGFDRDDNPEVLRLAHELGVIDAIEFSGRCRADELGSCYLSSRVLIVPSVYEGLPMVILEAMQHNLPVVATRVSGHPEIIEDGVSGLLVPPDDPQAMADAAVKMIEDEALAARCAAAARAGMDARFTTSTQLSGYLNEYDRLTIPRNH